MVCCMVKLIKREGKYVLPSDKIDQSKEMARRKIHALFGNMAKFIKFTAIRRDGTRGVSFSINGQKISFTYLSDLK